MVVTGEDCEVADTSESPPEVPERVCHMISNIHIQEQCFYSVFVEPGSGSSQKSQSGSKLGTVPVPVVLNNI